MRKKSLSMKTYPKDPGFKKKFGPRGVIKSTADGKIEDTGPLTIKRMETVDEEFYGAAVDFMKRQKQADKPFFVWFNATRMHVNTHLKPASKGKTGLGLQADGMVEHDAMVGDLLKFLDDNGLTENTIVIYSTDNGAMKCEWPDGGVSPFKGEKDMNWEGAFRVPCAVRWPGHIKPGTVFNDIFSAEDWLPTLVAAAGGDADLPGKAVNGVSAGAKHFRVHLDGYNMLPYLTGQVQDGPRHQFFYFSDDGDLMAYRRDRWKFNYMKQDAKGMKVWREPMDKLRAPILEDLRSDPFEYAHDHASSYYEKWYIDRAFLILPSAEEVGAYLATYKQFPPRQKPASFNVDEFTNALKAGIK